jgi:hypothetical protein
LMIFAPQVYWFSIMLRGTLRHFKGGQTRVDPKLQWPFCLNAVPYRTAFWSFSVSCAAYPAIFFMFVLKMAFVTPVTSFFLVRSWLVVRHRFLRDTVQFVGNFGQ